MPELPEAEVVARQLRDRVVGGTVEACRVRRADIVRRGLATIDWYRGGCIEAVERRGKSVVFSLRKEQETRYVVAELGMTGLLLLGVPAPRFAKHTHLEMTVSGAREQRLSYWNPRRFGRIYLLDRRALDAYTAKRFGCDPLTVAWEDFRRMVSGRRGRLKVLLMHQQALAGIGNIYANEILFRAGLHPHQRADRLSEARVRRLFDTMQEVLHEAIEAGGSSIRDFVAPDGTAGRFARRHLVYAKTGQACPNVCGRMIRRLAGERTSFYCPRCQRQRS